MRPLPAFLDVGKAGCFSCLDPRAAYRRVRRDKAVLVCHIASSAVATGLCEDWAPLVCVAHLSQLQHNAICARVCI